MPLAPTKDDSIIALTQDEQKELLGINRRLKLDKVFNKAAACIVLASSALVLSNHGIFSGAENIDAFKLIGDLMVASFVSTAFTSVFINDERLSRPPYARYNDLYKKQSAKGLELKKALVQEEADAFVKSLNAKYKADNAVPSDNDYKILALIPSDSLSNLEIPIALGRIKAIQEARKNDPVQDYLNAPLIAPSKSEVSLNLVGPKELLLALLTAITFTYPIYKWALERGQNGIEEKDVIHRLPSHPNLQKMALEAK